MLPLIHLHLSGLLVRICNQSKQAMFTLSAMLKPKLNP